MNRLSRAVALLAFAALPSAALAQKEPPDTKETKEAQKFLGLAMMRQTPEQKRPLYEQALKPLQEGMVKSATNAKVWLMAGQVYVGLGDFLGADSAFKKAQQLHPPYAEDISGEREVAWVEAFNAGIALMDQKNVDEAIKKLELAEMMYPHRPEAKMNLGALYAQRNDTQKAMDAFQKAIDATNGPLKEKLKPEDQANWKRYAEMAKLNIAQMAGAAGVEQFMAEKYDEAIASFNKAVEINPYSRDYLFNLGQSHYAKATKIEEQRTALLKEAEELTKAKKTAEAKAKTDEAAKIGETLLPMYAQLVELFNKVMLQDPSSVSLYDLVARSYKMSGDMVSDPKVQAEWRNKALDVLKKREELQFDVSEITVQTGDGDATVRGTLKNLKAAAGSPMKIRVTLVGNSGAPIGQQEFTVTAPAVDQTATFEGTLKTTGEVAGWKYEVIK